MTRRWRKSVCSIRIMILESLLACSVRSSLALDRVKFVEGWTRVLYSLDENYSSTCHPYDQMKTSGHNYSYQLYIKFSRCKWGSDPSIPLRKIYIQILFTISSQPWGWGIASRLISFWGMVEIVERSRIPLNLFGPWRTTLVPTTKVITVRIVMIISSYLSKESCALFDWNQGS